jgi:hypothetical protein
MATGRGLRRLVGLTSSYSQFSSPVAGTREALGGASTSGRGWDFQRSYHIPCILDGFNGVRQHTGIQLWAMHHQAERRPLPSLLHWALGSTEQIRWKWQERGGGRNTFLSVGNKEVPEYKTIGSLPAKPFTVLPKKVRALKYDCHAKSVRYSNSRASS